MSEQTDLIFHRCLCQRSPWHPSSCRGCNRCSKHGLGAEVCLSLNRFRSYVHASAERCRFIANNIRGHSSPKRDSCPEVDAFAIWLLLSGMKDPWKAHLYEIANAISDGEPYSGANQPDSAIRAYASKWKKEMLDNYLLRYTVLHAIPSPDDDLQSRMAFFFETILPDLKEPLDYALNRPAPSCLDKRQFIILKLILQEFTSPVSTFIVSKRAPNDQSRWEKAEFQNWGQLILSRDGLPKGKRYHAQRFVTFFVKENSMREKAGLGEAFIPGLKEKEVLDLLRFDDMKYYTTTDLYELGLAIPGLARVGVYPKGEIEVFKLLRKK